MNISKIYTTNISPKQNTAAAAFIKECKSTVQSSAAQGISNPLYYKDCFINKNLMTSFKGAGSDVPKDKNEFVQSLSKTGKYSTGDIDEILAMIDEIIEQDQWEETEEEILYEMFDSLAKSEKNSDLDSMKYITKEICKLEQDYDYIEVNPICKWISAVCSNLDTNDFKFQRIFTNGYGGILDCDDTESVYKLCDFIKNSLNNVNPSKFGDLLDILNSRINARDTKLQEESAVIEDFSSKYGYKDTELLDSLLMHYRENVAFEEIPSKLESRKAVSEVYNKLDSSLIPESIFFERVFAPPIEELVKRGYTPEQIAALLSMDDYCHKIIDIENMQSADPVILADFIEDIPGYTGSYEVMRDYTKSASLFNDLLSECEGNLDNIDLNKNYESDTGYKFSASEAKSAINELTAFLDDRHLKRDMTVYRGEGFEVLNQHILQNGELLGDAISNAVKKKDTDKLDEITAEILGSVIVQSHFMSSSYSKGNAKNFIKHEGGILWQIDAPKNSNAIYADPFNLEHGVEREILFNRDSALIIKDAAFEDGIYTIYADLINTDSDSQTD